MRSSLNPINLCFFISISTGLFMTGSLRAQPAENAKPIMLAIPKGVNVKPLITPELETKVHLMHVYQAIEAYQLTVGTWPKKPRELVDLHFLRAEKDLVDARHPVLQKSSGNREPRIEKMETFRFAAGWREGPIVTSDLPRNGKWAILTGKGEVYFQGVDPKWLGSYTPRKASTKDSFLDRPAAMLGAYLSDGKTDSGRIGIGVDGIIPGYYRHELFVRGSYCDLRPGDMILTIHGRRVQNLDELDEAIKAIGGIDASTWDLPLLEVIRDQKIVSVYSMQVVEELPFTHTPTPREAIRLAKLYETDPGPGSLGISSGLNEDKDSGVTLTSVSEHASKFFKVGDLVLEVDGTLVSQYLSDMGRRKKVGEIVKVRVRRDGREKTIDYPLEVLEEGRRKRCMAQIGLGMLDENRIRKSFGEDPDKIGITEWVVFLEHSKGFDVAMKYLNRALSRPTQYQAQCSQSLKTAKIDLLHRHGQSAAALEYIQTVYDMELESDSVSERFLFELKKSRIKVLIDVGRGSEVLAMLREMPIGKDEAWIRKKFFWLVWDVSDQFFDHGSYDAALVLIDAVDYPEGTDLYDNVQEARRMVAKRRNAALKILEELK